MTAKHPQPTLAKNKKVILLAFLITFIQTYNYAQSVHMAYVTNFDTYLTSDQAGDPLISMFEADTNIHITVIRLSQDDPNGPIDLSGYDVVVVQESFASSRAIYNPGQTLGISNISVPFLYNKVYAMRDGRAFTNGAAGSGSETKGTSGTLHLSVLPDNQSNELFNGATFINDDSIRIFETWADDDGFLNPSTDLKGMQYAVDVEVSGGSLLALPPDAPASATVCINDIPAGATIGSETLQARMIAFAMNYGAMSAPGNLTADGFTLWRNAVYSLAGLEVPEQPVVVPEEGFFTPDIYEVAFITDDEKDSVQIQWLKNRGFTVNTWWPSTVNDVSEGEIDILNNSDLIIVGRSPNSSDLHSMKYELNNLWMPLLSNNVYGARNSRLNWFNTSDANHVNETPETFHIHIKTPSDDIFTGVTLTAEDSLDYSIAPHDFLFIDANTLAESNSEIIGANDDLVAIARFDPAVEFYPGSIDQPVGYRTYFGFGNDVNTDNLGNPIINYFPLTNTSESVYYEEIKRLIELGDSGERPKSNDATLSALVVGENILSDPSTLDYTVILGAGAVNVPSAQVTASHSGATVEISYASDLSGTTTIVVTAEDGLTAVTYTISYETRNSDLKTILFVGNASNDADHVLMDSLALMGSDGYNVVLISGAEFSAGFTDASAYQNYDLLFVSESVSSGDVNTYGLAGFPISAFLSEPYALNKDNIRLGDINSETVQTDLLTNMIITNDTHPITKGHYTADQSIQVLTDNGPFNIWQYEAVIPSNILHEKLGRPDVSTASNPSLYADHPSWVIFKENQVISGDPLIAIPAGTEIILHAFHSGSATQSTPEYMRQVRLSVEYLMNESPDTSHNPKGQRHICLVGGVNVPEFEDAVLIDSLEQYLDITYLSASEFNESSSQYLYSDLGIEGVIFSESIGSSTVPNFGTNKDNFPVPSISLEAGAYFNSWSEGFSFPSVWGFAGAEARAEDLQWKIKDPGHPILENLDYETDQIVTYSVNDPTTRGVPYLTAITTQVNVLAVATRTDPGSQTNFVQDQAIAMAEFPLQKSFFMNVSKSYHEPNMGTQDFFNILRQACYYMFDAYAPVELSGDAGLLDLVVNGESLEEFDSAVINYEVELPIGTFDIPGIELELSNSKSVAEMIQATGIPGTTIIKVTAPNGNVKSYFVKFVFTDINNITLSDLKVDDTTVDGFADSVLIYDVILPDSITTVPSVSATPSDPEFTLNITNATSIPGTATVEVTAKDEVTTQVYQINFTAEEKPEELNNSNFETALVIFPNPVKDVLTVESQTMMNKVELFTMNGKLIDSFKVDNLTKVSLSVGDIPKGLYLIRAYTSDREFTQRKVIR